MNIINRKEKERLLTHVIPLLIQIQSLLVLINQKNLSSIST